MSNTEAEQALQDALLTTYYANLNFLLDYDKKLFLRIDSLSHVINSGEYEERYSLEFVKEDGDFDIFDKKYEKYLYNKKAKKYNNSAADQVNFDKKGTFSIFDPTLFSGERSTVDAGEDPVQEPIKGMELLFRDVNEYVDILKDNVSAEDKKYKRIEKFIFIGTLLGRHIPKIAHKVNAKNYLVCESNLEIFRLSLFVFDYTLLAKESNVRFSIMDDSVEFSKTVMDFLVDNSYENYAIKYFTTEHNVKEIFDHIADEVLKVKPTVFNYNMLLHNVLNNTASRINKYKTLVFKEERRVVELFRKTPVLFVGAGPSLEENIDWIKENQNKFIIVAMGASYGKLLNHGVSVDIITTLDSKLADLSLGQFKLEDTQRIQDVNILASMNTAEGILDRFNQDKLFLYEIIKNFKENAIVGNGMSIGEFTFRMLLELGVENLYLIGTDLALNQNTGATHSAHHNNVKQFDMEQLEDDSLEKTSSFSLHGDIIETEGNFHKKVITSRVLKLSLDYYNMAIEFKKENQNVYNLSTHGARIDNTIILHPNDCDVNVINELDKSGLSDVLTEAFNSISENELSKNERQNMQQEIVYLEEIITLIEKLAQMPSTSFKIFRDKNLELHSKVLLVDKKVTFVPIIFSFYFRVINSYISYHFNENKIKKEAKKIAEVEAIWYKQTRTILEKYIEFLNRALS